MRIYESTFILSPQADDAAFDRQINAITDLIERNDGKTIKEDRWGIRRLAFPIKKYTQGYYTRLVFEANNKVLTELERFYKLEESYIRYLTVLFEGDHKERIFDDAVKSVEAKPKPVLTEKKEKSVPTPETTVSNEPENVEPAAEETSSISVAEEVKAEEPSAETTVSEPVNNDEPEKTEE